jgi:LysM repeat protein
MGTAQAQANYIAAIGSVTHSGPGGIQLTQRLLNAGYPFAGDLSLGGFRVENITGGNKSATQAVQGWTGDAPHLNTMLSPKLTEIGAGVAKVGDRYYMVIDCARPTIDGQPQAYTPDPDDTVIGTSVPSDFIVPIITSTPDENGWVYHEVQYGQTLWAIAIEYGVKIDEIRALNNLRPGTDIYQGDRLLVRKDAPPSSVPSPVSVTVTPSRQDVSPTPLIFATVTNTPVTSPTIISDLISTPSHVTSVDESNSTYGLAVGIVLLALLLAAMFTWASSRRPG